MSTARISTRGEEIFPGVDCIACRCEQRELIECVSRFLSRRVGALIRSCQDGGLTGRPPLLPLQMNANRSSWETVLKPQIHLQKLLSVFDADRLSLGGVRSAGIK